MHRGIRKLFTHLILLYTTLYLPKRRFLLEYSVKIPNKSSLFTAGQCFSKKINSLYAICHNKKLPVKMKKQSKRRSALHVFKTMVSISISYLIFFPPMYLSRKERTHEEAKEKKKVHSSGHPPLHCNNQCCRHYYRHYHHQYCRHHYCYHHHLRINKSGSGILQSPVNTLLDKTSSVISSTVAMVPFNTC